MDWARIVRLLLFVFLAASVGCGVYATVNAVHRIHIVHQLDYEEGNILNAAQLINQGHSPYPDPHGWPVVINPYGPLPYYLTAIPVHFFGPHFAPARAIILIATLLCAVFLGLLLQHFTRSLVIAIGFGALFLSQALVQFWMAILRVDMIALLLALAGVYVFVRFPRWWMLSVILLSASIFTKYSFLAAPSTCVVYLLVQKQWRRAVQFAIALGAMLLLFFGATEIVTHGAFSYDVLFSHADPITWSRYVTFYFFLLIGNPLLTLMAGTALVWTILRRDFTFPVLYLIFAMIGTASAGKLGSNMNHLSELVGAMCIVVGVFVAQSMRRGGAAALTTATLSVLIGLWMVFQLPYAPTSAPAPGCGQLYNFVAQTPSDRFFSEDVGALVVNNKTVWVSNPFVYAQLAIAGKTPDNQLQQHLQQKWFDFVFLREDPHGPSERLSPASREILLQNYDLSGEVLCMDASLVYTPKSAAAP